jgi:nitrogen regulatory protein PII
MHLHTLRLVRIVAEKRLADDLVALLVASGVRGYTYYDAAGFGQHGHRRGSSDTDANIIIETLVGDADADAILARVHELFLPRHSLVAYVLEARTLQREKFL